MHIPDSMLNGVVCPVSAAVAVTGLAGAAYALTRSTAPVAPARFGAVAAFVFAAQMLNFPISGGTSGHMIGGALATALLGWPAGILAIALVVSLQCLVFSDGGLLVLGCNLLNMALLGAGVPALLHFAMGRTLSARSPLSLAITGMGAWLSVVVASSGCSLMLALDGASPWNQVIPAMLGTHVIIGLGEALATVAVVAAVSRLTSAQHPPDTAPATPKLLVIASAIMALVLSPFASSHPDGLEWVAEKLGFLHGNAPAFTGLLEDYALPFISSEFLSTGLAGIFGAAIAYSLGLVCLTLLSMAARRAE